MSAPRQPGPGSRKQAAGVFAPGLFLGFSPADFALPGRPALNGIDTGIRERPSGSGKLPRTGRGDDGTGTPGL